METNTTRIPPKNRSQKTLFIVLFVLLALATAIACSGFAYYLHDTILDVDSSSISVVDAGEDVFGDVVVLPIHGIIGEFGSLFGAHGTTASFVKWYLGEIDDMKTVKAILLDVSTPGGSVYHSDEIYNMFLQQRKKGIRIFAHFRSIATSGGYYVSSAAEMIYCDPTCLTGSISVKMEVLNLAELMKSIGLKMEVIKSAKYKDILSPYRPVESEERLLIQEIIDEYYERFVGIVANSRKMTVDKTREIADGRIYTATQAIANGLIDRIAYRPEVFADIRSELGGKVNFVEIVSKKSILSFLTQKTQRSSLEERLAKGLLMDGRPMFLYLWK